MASDYEGKSYPEQATGLYDLSYENLGDYTHVEVLWLENLKPGAAHPPGLSQWPGPREVVASPALLSAEGGREFVQRYGKEIGTIGAAGLVNPKEKLLYVGIDPSVHVTSARQEVIDGFGAGHRTLTADDGAVTSSDQGYAGDVLYQWSRPATWTTITLFGLAPCLILIGIAIRLGGERRDQYIAWLSAIGASPTTIRRYLAKETLAPITAGSLVGLGVVGLTMIADWTIPGFGAVIVGSDLRAAWPPCLACSAAVSTFMLLLLFANHRIRRHAAVKPRARAGRSRPGLILVLIALIAIQSYAYAFLYPTDPGAASTYSTLTAAAVIVLLAPCGGALLSFASKVTLGLAHRTGSPAALVTARELGALPRPALRTAAVIAAAILITVQSLILLAGPNQMETTANAAIASDPMLVVPISQTAPDDSWLPRAANGLPSSVATVRVVYKNSDSSQPPSTISTTCAQVRRFGGTCNSEHTSLGQILRNQSADARAKIAVRLPMSTSVDIVPSLAGISGDAFAIATNGHRLDPTQLSTELGKFASPTPEITSQWTPFLVGAHVAVANARWLLLVGAMAALIFFVAGTLALWFEAIRVARRTASLAMVMDPKRTSTGLGIGLVGIPVAAATLLGILAAVGFAIAPTSVPGSEISMPWAYFALLAALGVALSLVAGLLAARAIRERGTRWIPADNDT